MGALRYVLVLLCGLPIAVELGLRPARAAGEEVVGHWAYRPIRWVEAPSPGEPPGASEIDRLVNRRLRSERLWPPAPPADARTLLRRLSFDLVGLPPAPSDVDAFVAECRRGPEDARRAYEARVDSLLASPHFGEKWARHWMDLCRYADTDGYLTDQPRPHAWRYRHWLVEALNRDLPFDEFTVQQLAGDLLPAAGRPPEERLNRLVATGFLRQTLSNREGGADLEEFRVEQVADRVALVGTTWLGLTIACARCHDHKYDRLTQKEYFQLYAYLNGVDEVNVDAPLPGGPRPTPNQVTEYRRRREEILRPILPDLERLQADWESRMLAAAMEPGRDHRWDREWEVLGLIWGGGEGEGQLEGCRIVEMGASRRTPEQAERLQDYFLKRGDGQYGAEFKRLGIAALREQVEKARTALPKPPRAPAMAETFLPRPARVHLRGNFRAPGEVVTPGVPGVTVTGGRPAGPSRLDLARWLVSGRHPLTARVAVNRIWQELFGTGLVATPENFGTRGEPPSHADVLDLLASRFQEPEGARGGRGLGWSQKRLIRWIVLSDTYRRSSVVPPGARPSERDFRLLRRGRPLRLPAEAIRDAALAVSGLLNPEIGGPSVFPPQPPGVSEEAYSNKWTPSTGADRYRRGLYTWVQRLSPFAQGVTFDAPAPARSCARRERSNSPLQALTLLNDPVFVECAEALGRKVLREGEASDADKVDLLFRTVLARRPRPEEAKSLADLLGRERARGEACAEAPSRREERAWTSAATVVLNLHEFITRD